VIIAPPKTREIIQTKTEGTLKTGEAINTVKQHTTKQAKPRKKRE